MQFDSGFQRTLDRIRGIAESERHKGLLFERLMQAYFLKDPLYRDRFSSVSLWTEWAGGRAGFDRTDTGIDLVAEERDGGYCAIQCKCYAPGTRIMKGHLDSFISASARDPFTARIVVDTGDEWGRTAVKTVEVVKPACTVLRFRDLAGQTFDWPDLIREEPEALRYRSAPYELRPHQRQAVDDVLAGLAVRGRGKLVMACGTGKTFTALRIAEAAARVGGRVLYLVPSISLFAQTMREWATQKAVPHRYVGICSDTRAGRTDEDATMQELEIPVATDPDRIAAALGDGGSGAMIVVFCTYHSLEIVARAQDGGAPPFDLVLCDEAHRTTGVDRPSDRTSPFVLVHDGDRVRAAKRLYMTATPRIYTEGAKTKAASHDAEVFSMDDEATYGPELHRLPFSRAVDQDLLSDYKVVILALAEQHFGGILEADAATGGASEINITDAAKIVGCWRALQKRRGVGDGDGSLDGEAERPLTRAIAFANTIRDSRRLEAHWDRIVEQAIKRLPEPERTGALRCETRHVDGKHHALERRERIDWLKGESPGACRILSNARCLSEGIDVPALDAVFFMAPRKSQVEIVQAVGRAMRKAPGKRYGYIVLPVAIPPGMSAEKALNDNKRFGAVWGVLRALRSHDDRFDAEINRIDLNKNPTDRIIVDIDVPGGQIELGLPPLHLPPGAIYAKIVDKCGDRKYWETWANDIADIFARLVERLNGLLANPANEALVEWFGGFHEELRVSINEAVTREAAIDMVAQHILTRPVFDALFDNYDFASGNPVARALEELRGDFGEFGLENEIRDMERFYESVRRRARGLDNSEARQRVLKELYENFFRTAVKKQADRLGIVYTPTEVVDFILSSADHVLREEFGRGLTDEGVNVLDPFTGTGLFLARLLQLPAADPGRGPATQVQGGTACKRDRAARLLHRGRQHRGGVPGAAKRASQTRTLRRNRADRHLQPEHAARRVPQAVPAGQQRARRAPRAPPDTGDRRQSALVGRTAEFGRRQPQRGLPRAEEARGRYLRRPLHRDPQEQPLRHLQDGDPLGLGPDRRARGDRDRGQRVMDRRERGLGSTRVSGGGVLVHSRGEPAGEPADARRALPPRGRKGLRAGIAGAGGDHDPRAEPQGRARRMPHPVPRHRRLPDAEEQTPQAARLGLGRRDRRLARDHARPPPRLDRAACPGVPGALPGGLKGGQGGEGGRHGVQACLLHSWVCLLDLQVRVTGKARAVRCPRRRA